MFISILSIGVIIAITTVSNNEIRMLSEKKMCAIKDSQKKGEKISA